MRGIILEEFGECNSNVPTEENTQIPVVYNTNLGSKIGSFKKYMILSLLLLWKIKIIHALKKHSVREFMAWAHVLRLAAFQYCIVSLKTMFAAPDNDWLGTAERKQAYKDILIKFQFSD